MLRPRGGGNWLIWWLVMTCADLIKDTSTECVGKHVFHKGELYFCGIDALVTTRIELTDDQIQLHSCQLNQVDVTANATIESNTIVVKYSVKEGDLDREFRQLPVECSVLDSNQTLVSLNYIAERIAIYAQTPVIDALIADSHSGILGIGDTMEINVQLASSLRRIAGNCTFGTSYRVSFETTPLAYQVQQDEVYILADKLRANCVVTDAAGNEGRFHGFVQESPVIDGTIPRVSVTDPVLVSDTPARVNSVITISFRATDMAQPTEYEGNCTVNGHDDLPMRQMKDNMYTVIYRIEQNDTDHIQTLDTSCIVYNPAGNTFHFSQQLPIDFEIDATIPKIKTVSLLFASDAPAHEGTVIEVQIVADDNDRVLKLGQTCQVNDRSVVNAFSHAGKQMYVLTYIVGAAEAHWKMGELKVHCELRDAAGNVAVADHFTDENTLAGIELKPVEFDPHSISVYLPDTILVVGFFVVAVASHTVSNVCPKVGLPRITGYFITGLLAGPYVLELITDNEMKQLRFIDEMSLGYIGIAAGSKLHWAEMRPLVRSIAWVTICLTIIEYVVGTGTIILLADHLEFLRSTTNAERYTIALLAGCMMIARSPSSALAVIQELKSKGRFTTLTFAVTVVCDMLVIFLFNINSMIAEAFLSGESMSHRRLLQLFLQICLSIGAGAVTGKLLGFLLLKRTSIKRKSTLYSVIQVVKMVLLLTFGFATFVVSHLVSPWLEPLLTCMVAGATLRNCSSSPDELDILVKRLASFVYVCFFTLSGAGLELHMLPKAIIVSCTLCLTRIGAIFLGSYIGGTLAREDKQHNRVSWMAYVTQAGVTLGLAKQIQLLYPGWGGYFATFVIAVVICNQLIGPLLLRHVLRRVGDARIREKGKVDGLRALILSRRSYTRDMETQTSSVQSRMKSCGWNVDVSFFTNGSFTTMEEMAPEVKKFITKNEPLDVVVVMMPSDELNYQLIRAVALVCNETKRLSVLRLVVSVLDSNKDTNWAWKFSEMAQHEENGDAIDVVVVDHAAAVDMLIELAAKGHVMAGAEVSSPRPAFRGRSAFSARTSFELKEIV